MMMQVPLPFGPVAVRGVKKLRGGSQAQLMAASDGNSYVVKFRNNPQHVRVLANELLASRLGQWLGLAVPRAEIIDVPQDVIERDRLCIDYSGHSRPCESGPQLGSLYVSDDERVFDFLPDSQLLKVTNLNGFAEMLVLDKWAGNADGRQAVFTPSPEDRRRYTAAFIDHGYCFNAGEWTFPDFPMHGIYWKRAVYEHVTGWESFEPILSRAEQIDLTALWKMARDIPEGWYEQDAAGLCRIIEALYRRRTILRDLITAFRLSERRPFPRWSEN